MIYDCFTFYNELELLKIRMEVMDSVADFFVIVEANRTFSNQPKVLYFKENKNLFKKFEKKIIHIVVNDMPGNPIDAWEMEHFQRNAITRGLVNCTKEDYVIISDLDEIPNPDKIREFKGEFAILEQDIFYYKLNCKVITEQWRRAVILKLENLSTPQKLRDFVQSVNEVEIIKKGGWHFSYLGSPDFISEKIKSFSHQEFNNEKYNNLNVIKGRILKHEDLFGRELSIMRFVEIDSSFPRFIFINRNKLTHLIHYLTDSDRNMNIGNEDLMQVCKAWKLICDRKDIDYGNEIEKVAKEWRNVCDKKEMQLREKEKEVVFLKSSIFFKLRNAYMRLFRKSN
jgi:hypothetical protein